MSTLTKHLNPIRNMFLLDNEDYDPFTDFFTTFGKALNTDRSLTDIKDNGDVFACEQLSTPIGNLSTVDYDLSKIWFSDIAKQQRRSIANKECHCTYECVSSCNILFNPKNYPRLVKEAFSSEGTREHKG